jgi:hypothetical protein
VGLVGRSLVSPQSRFNGGDVAGWQAGGLSEWQRESGDGVASGGKIRLWSIAKADERWPRKGEAQSWVCSFCKVW